MNKTKLFYVYVYVYLDPNKLGMYKYGEYEFDYEPFYVGKGCENRAFNLTDRKYNRHLYIRIKKIKNPVIKIIKYFSSEKECFDLERELILLIGRKWLYKGPLVNFTDGGGGISGYVHTKEAKEKISKAHTGRVFSKETLEKMSKIKTGKKMSPESCENVRKSLLGRKASEKTKKILREGQLGEKNSNAKHWEVLFLKENRKLQIYCLKSFCEENELSYQKTKKYAHQNKEFNGMLIKLIK